MAISLENLVRYLPHTPSHKQRQALKYGCRELLYGGAAGGGKSDYLLMAALQGVMIPEYSAILFRRTYQDLSLPGALLDRSHSWWSGTDAHWSGEQKTWTFPTGSRIGFGYMDGPRDHERYQSAEFQFVGFDESGHFEQRQVMYMLSRLRASLTFPRWLGMRMRLATNPGGIGHEFQKARYCIPAEGTRDIIEQRDKTGRVVRVFVPSLAHDNPGLDVHAYLENLALLDPITRAQLERGEWLVDSTGLVYYCYENNCNVAELPQIIPLDEWRYVLGCDFGSSDDATAFVVCAYSPHEPEVYIAWSEEHKRMSPQEAAMRVGELTEQFGGFASVVGDSGGLGAAYVLEMQKHWALPIAAAEKQHKLAFIRLMNGEFTNGRLKVLPHMCESFVRQAKILQWHDSQRLKENQSQDNHSTDAALYAWRECRHYSAMEREKPKPVDSHKQAIIERNQRDEWARTGTDLWD